MTISVAPPPNPSPPTVPPQLLSREWEAARIMTATYDLAIDPELAEWLRQAFIFLAQQSFSVTNADSERGGS